MALHLACAVCVCGRRFGGGVAGWQLSRERQASLATTTRYMITDHRHAPSKHNSQADKRLQPWLRVCLPASAAPRCGILKKYIYIKTSRRQTQFTQTTWGFRDVCRILPSLLQPCEFPTHPMEGKSAKSFLHRKLTQQFDCDKRSLKNMRVYATARASVPAVRSIWGQVGRWWRRWYGVVGVYPSALRSLTRCLRSLSVLLLFLNTDPYLPTAQELSRLTSLTLTQARIKSGLFTQQPRLY